MVPQERGGVAVLANCLILSGDQTAECRRRRTTIGNSTDLVQEKVHVDSLAPRRVENQAGDVNITIQSGRLC